MRGIRLEANNRGKGESRVAKSNGFPLFSFMSPFHLRLLNDSFGVRTFSSFPSISLALLNQFPVLTFPINRLYSGWEKFQTTTGTLCLSILSQRQPTRWKWYPPLVDSATIPNKSDQFRIKERRNKEVSHLVSIRSNFSTLFLIEFFFFEYD